MEDTPVFYKLRAKDGCFFGGHKYWYNTKYKSKDGIVTEYYVCDNKWVIHFVLKKYIFIVFFIPNNYLNRNVLFISINK